MLRILSILFIMLPSIINADSYPGFKSVYLNDYANIIDDDAEARIIRKLETLFDDHGVEASVLTIEARKNYDASASIESFARGLFNNWGIGDAAKNDGILILISRFDREMRVELGTGYGRDYDSAAARVIDSDFLPYFRNDKYSEGIEAGTSEVIRRIAVPFAKGSDAPNSDSFKVDPVKTTFFTAIFGLILYQLRRVFGDLFTRFRKCPNCGRKNLRRKRKITQSASKSAAGRGKSTTTCQHCNYFKTDTYVIPRRSRSRSSRSSFGGGSSSGGGASGRW